MRKKLTGNVSFMNISTLLCLCIPDDVILRCDTCLDCSVKGIIFAGVNFCG